MSHEAAPKLPPLSEVISRHGLTPRKRYGQHFLLDPHITERIARLVGDLSGVVVLEIGPGPGGLTRAIVAAGAKRTICVERDARFLPALGEIEAAFPGRVTVIGADALEIDEASLLHGRARIIANLPYNIATPLLFKWLALGTRLEGMTLMFQREVAERLVAAPRTRAYGRLAVMCQWYCDVRRAFEVPPGAFVPAPKVTSAVVLLTPRAAPPAPADPHALRTVVGAAFGQRRKMLRSSLKSLGTDPLALLDAARIAPTMRAETLCVEEFCALARAYEDVASRGASGPSGQARE